MMLFAMSVVSLIGATMENHKGFLNTCVHNDLYEINYNGYGYDSNHFVQLDNINGLDSYTCNIDSTEVDIGFTSMYNADMFSKNITQTHTFIIENEIHNCPYTDGTRTMVRRILFWNMTSPNILRIRVAPSRLDELFESTSLSMVMVDKNSTKCVNYLNDFTENICVGVNTNSDCSQSLKPLPMYSNKYLSVSCSNCFIGLDTELFVDMEIKHWHLHRLAGGFKNIKTNMALVESMSATGSWSIGYDHTIHVVNPKTIIDFHIWIIPVRIWFEIDSGISADLSFHASANAEVGVTGSIGLGDAYLQWDHSGGWSSVGPSLGVVDFKPHITGQSNFDGEGSFGLSPKFTIHIDNVFDYSLSMDLTSSIDVTGDTESKQICASNQGEFKITGEAELHINVPFTHLGHQTWGPSTYLDKNFNIFDKKCVKV